MTIQEEAQAKIDTDKHEQQVYQMRSRLEQKAKLEKQLADLVEEIAKIEISPLPTSMNYGNPCNTLLGLTSSYGISTYPAPLGS